MPSRASITIASGLLGIAVVAGCTSGPAVPRRVAGHHEAGRQLRPQPLTHAAAESCPKTTISHIAAPPGATLREMNPGTSVYGNRSLLVALAVNGVIVANGDMLRPHGSIWWKFPWWRLVPGDLTITGKRLDAPAPPLTPFVPNGYGDTGFQASGVIFPSEGCWQVTGTLGHASVTFVTLVLAQAHRSVLATG
jgi:hypothetical protein